MIHAALSGELDRAGFQTDPIFNIDVRKSCPDVPADILQPKSTWADKAAYGTQAKKLAKMFAENFKAFEATASDDVKAAGPKP
jgi:phosphoenolpyruvate carboxykinase (ATP)